MTMILRKVGLKIKDKMMINSLFSCFVDVFFSPPTESRMNEGIVITLRELSNVERVSFNIYL